MKVTAQLILDTGFLQAVDDTWKGYKTFNDELFYPNKLNEYPGLSSLNKMIKYQDATKLGWAFPTATHLNIHNFQSGINVASLQFAENLDYNFHWQYALTKRLTDAKFYISDKAMTWQEAYEWPQQIGQKSFGLLSIQEVRQMIADQANATVYNENAFKSQYYNQVGGIRQGNVWV